jgi:hypothetical protein
MRFPALFKKNENGALTVEAAIALPIFMCVVLTLAFFIKVQYVQNNVQYSLDQAANELSTYSYLYSVTGLQAANNGLKKELNDRQELASGHVNDIIDSYDALSASPEDVQKSYDAVSDGDYSKIGKFGQIYNADVDDTKKILSTLKEAGKDPKKEFVSIASLIMNNGFEAMKSELATPVIKFFMYKYIDKGILNSKGGPGAYVSTELGDDDLECFDLSNSTIFKDNKTIDIVVRYKIKTVLPINFLPGIEMEQRATVRGWLTGDADSVDKEESSSTGMWEKPPFEYGKSITALELKNYPVKYPDSGDAYEVRSINLTANSYKDLGNLKKTINQSTNKFNGMKLINSKPTSSKTLIVVVPEGTLTDQVKKVVKESEEFARSKGITLLVKEGYGKAKVITGDESSNSTQVQQKQG